jgi:hypothetical protein
VKEGRWIVLVDRASLLGMALGVLVLLLPAAGAFRSGFFLVLAATAAQIVFSHLAASRR